MEKTEKIKKALSIVKLARRLGHNIYHAIMSGDVAKHEIIKPLEDISGWNNEDEKKMLELAEKIRPMVSNKMSDEEKRKVIEIIISGKE